MTTADGRVMRRLSAVIGPLKWWIIAAALISALTLAAGIGLIATSGYLISRSALIDTTETVTLAIVAVRFFAVTRAVGRYLERYVGHLATFRALTRVRVWFFRGVEPGAPASLVDQQSGDTLTRMVDDVEALQDLPLRVLVPRIAAVLAAAVGIGVLGVLDVRLGVAIAGFLLVGGVILPLLTRGIGRAAAGALVAEQAELRATAVEGVGGLADLVAYGREDLLTGRIDELTQTRRAAERRLAVLRGLNAALAGALAGLAAVTTLALAIPLVRDGRLDGVLLAVVPLTVIASFEAVAPVAVSYEHRDRTAAAADRLFDLVDRPAMVTEPTDPVVLPPGPGALGFDHVTFRYQPDQPDALVDATFEIPARAQVAIVGPSGAGKSTIAALLLRFWEPQHGSIRLDDVGLRDLGSEQARAAVAVVAQRDHLFDTTVRDNLLLGDADADDDRMMDVCRAVALDDLVQSWPEGLATRVGENGCRLSGGERQRLMIARAMLTEAPILVLDEATAHLDEQTERRVLDGVRAWRGGATTLHIAHHAAALGGADVVLHVRGGRVTSTDLATDVARSNPPEIHVPELGR